LRLEPYYRATAREYPSDAPYFQRLIASVLDHPRSLVHADFSPKNLLVYRGGLMLVDFETGHFGDPAFDLGFFLSHLTLKSFFHAPRHDAFLDLIDAFGTAYETSMRPAIGDGEYQSLVMRGIQNLAGCAWARLDGTSRVDYLTEPARRDAVRSFCRELFSAPPVAWRELIERSRRALEFTARQE
jgi:5-methylthioribose kinase